MGLEAALNHKVCKSLCSLCSCGCSWGLLRVRALLVGSYAGGWLCRPAGLLPWPAQCSAFLLRLDRVCMPGAMHLWSSRCCCAGCPATQLRLHCPFASFSFFLCLRTRSSPCTATALGSLSLTAPGLHHHFEPRLFIHCPFTRVSFFFCPRTRSSLLTATTPRTSCVEAPCWRWAGRGGEGAGIRTMGLCCRKGARKLAWFEPMQVPLTFVRAGQGGAPAARSPACEITSCLRLMQCVQVIAELMGRTKGASKVRPGQLHAGSGQHECCPCLLACLLPCTVPVAAGAACLPQQGLLSAPCFQFPAFSTLPSVPC